MLATIANHLWQSTLFVAVAALLAFALRQNGARIRYWLWMAASLKFLLPFSVLVALGRQFSWRFEAITPASIGDSLSTARPWANFAGSVVQPVDSYAGMPAIQTNLANFNSIWSLEFIMFAVWAAGFVGVLGLWTVRWLRMQALLRTAEPLAPEAAKILNDFPVPVKFVRSQLEPGVVGIFRPVLLFPFGLYERLTRKQLQAILAHERCHLERRDNLTAAVHMLVEAAFWFHPFVWWIGARLVEERERACDAAVLGAGNDPEIYAEGILDVCQHYVAAPLECVAGVSGADLKKRVRSIMTFTGETRLHFAKWALLTVVAFVVVASPILVGAFTASRAEAQAAAQTEVIDGEWPKIESASIALSQIDNPLNKGLLINPSGAFTTRNWSLRGLVAFAYNIQESEIIEPSANASDLASSRYNITAKVARSSPEDTVTTKEHLLAARRLLAEQFQLQFHWETERVPVYALTFRPGSTGMKVAKEGEPGPHVGRGVNSITGRAAPIILLKQFLANQLHRPVVDQTGLTASYNFTLKWGPEAGEEGAPSDPETVKDPPRDVLLKAMEEQLGLTITSQDGEVRRLVVDRLHQPAKLTPPPAEIELDAAVFERYVGSYDFPPARVMKVYRDGIRLFAQLTGQVPMQIYAASDREFFSKVVDGRLTFTTDAAGRGSSFVLSQGGQHLKATRIDDAEAKAREDSLAQRIRDKIAQPGTEAALRGHLEGLRIDQPIYDRMTKETADSIREGWRATKDRYPQLGQLNAIEFTGVGPVGADVYLAKYENATSEWRVHLNSDGKLDILNYRRVWTR